MGCGRSSVPRKNTQEKNPVKLVLKNRVYFGQNYIIIVVSIFSDSHAADYFKKVTEKELSSYFYICTAIPCANQSY